MQGRSFVFASQFSRVLPPEMAGQYVDAVIQVLEAQDITVPVKVSAVRAVKKCDPVFITFIGYANFGVASAQNVQTQPQHLVRHAYARASRPFYQSRLLTR